MSSPAEAFEKPLYPKLESLGFTGSAIRQRLHKQATVVIAHDHTMYGLAVRRSRGERAVFSNHYAPLARQGGVNVIGWVVGGDPPLFGIEIADSWWGFLALLDMLWQEAEESHDTLTICLNCQDIDEAVVEGKVAAVMTMEGGLALGEGLCPESLVNLRTLYRLGLRSLQFVGQDWNRLTDARGQEWPGTSKGLTQFGKNIVREMNRLGMVIDMAHIPDPDPLFWDVIEISQDPIIDSHRCVRGANDIPRNISDERIKAIAKTGGVIGLQFFSSTLASETGNRATVDDLIRHIDHIVKVAGVEYVGLGPDFLEPELINREPGHYAQGIDEITKLPSVTVAPHLTVERANSPTQRLILGNSRGFRLTFAQNWSLKRALRTTFWSTTV